MTYIMYEAIELIFFGYLVLLYKPNQEKVKKGNVRRSSCWKTSSLEYVRQLGLEYVLPLLLLSKTCYCSALKLLRSWLIILLIFYFSYLIYTDSNIVESSLAFLLKDGFLSIYWFIYFLILYLDYCHLQCIFYEK